MDAVQRLGEYRRGGDDGTQRFGYVRQVGLQRKISAASVGELLCRLVRAAPQLHERYRAPIRVGSSALCIDYLRPGEHQWGVYLAMEVGVSGIHNPPAVHCDPVAGGWPISLGHHTRFYFHGQSAAHLEPDAAACGKGILDVVVGRVGIMVPLRPPVVICSAWHNAELEIAAEGMSEGGGRARAVNCHCESGHADLVVLFQSRVEY